MRKEFFQLLELEMAANQDIVFLTGDLGFGFIDGIQKLFPDRFYNFQVTEFTMVGAAIGLSLSGKIPIVYSIAPFLIYRPFELIRTYINHERIPVKLVASGRDFDYLNDGMSHYSHDVSKVLDIFDNIRQYYPKKENLKEDFSELLYNGLPSFLSLKK
jgi:transketolase